MVSVGFLPPIFRSLVPQTPALKPFNKKKEIKPEKIISNNNYFVFIFSNFCIAETKCIPYYFTSHVKMVYKGLIAHYVSQIINKIF